MVLEQGEQPPPKRKVEVFDARFTIVDAVEIVNYFF